MGFIIMYSRDSKEFVGCEKRQATYESRHRADLFHYTFDALNLSKDRRHHIHTHKLDEDDIIIRKERR